MGSITPGDWKKLFKHPATRYATLAQRLVGVLGAAAAADDSVEAASRRLALPTLAGLLVLDGVRPVAVERACRLLGDAQKDSDDLAWLLLARSALHAGVVDSLAKLVCAGLTGTLLPDSFESLGSGPVRALVLLVRRLASQGERRDVALMAAMGVLMAFVRAPTAGDASSGASGDLKTLEQLLRLPEGPRWEDTHPHALVAAAGGNAVIEGLCEVVGLEVDWYMGSAPGTVGDPWRTLAGCLQIAGLLAHVFRPSGSVMFTDQWHKMFVAIHATDRLLVWMQTKSFSVLIALLRPDVQRALPPLMKLAAKMLSTAAGLPAVEAAFMFIPVSLAARWVEIYLTQWGRATRSQELATYLEGLAGLAEGMSGRITAAVPGEDGTIQPGLVACSAARATFEALAALRPAVAALRAAVDGSLSSRGVVPGSTSGTDAQPSAGTRVSGDARGARAAVAPGDGAATATGALALPAVAALAGSRTEAVETAAATAAVTAAAQSRACRVCGVTNVQLRARGEPPEVKLRLCVVCRGVAYCGVACQRSDWRRHKQECSHLK